MWSNGRDLPASHGNTGAPAALGLEPESGSTACAGSDSECPPGRPTVGTWARSHRTGLPVAAENSIRPALCGR